MSPSSTKSRIAIRFMDGRLLQAVLGESFAPHEELIQVEENHHPVSYRLSSIAYMCFSGQSQRMDQTISESNHAEVVVCVDGTRHHVYTAPERYFRQGFFGIPVEDLDDGTQRIFFTEQGVRQRIVVPDGDDGDDTDPIAGERKSPADPSPASDGLVANDLRNRAQKTHQAFQRIGDILCSIGMISEVDLREALQIQQKNRSHHLGKILLDHGFVSQEQLLMALAMKFHLRFVKLDEMKVRTDVISKVSEAIAQQLRVFPIDLREDDTLVVATSEPSNFDVFETLRFHTGHRIEWVVATPEDIAKKLAQYYSGEEEALQLLIQNDTADEDKVESIHRLESEASQTPVIRLANKILLDGINRRASDIHLFSDVGALKVLYRTDGAYRPGMRLDMSIHQRLITRFKIISNMDITERRLPQDGYIRLFALGRQIEMRVSCMPGVLGENMVFRIFDVNQKPRTLIELGYSARDADSVYRAANAPFGLILVTGATGSGKSSTLTSIMNALREQPKHLISLEDPVETQLPGVEQIPINEAIGFTFAKALRNVLRHDPDVVMVGEIRDEDTARIAVQASLTGHILLSTLHTNNASAAFMRMIDMGVKPYLIASTVKLILAQKLIPRLCPDCKQEVDLSWQELDFMNSCGISRKIQRGFQADGCENCEHTGIRGRILIYEVLPMNKTIHDLVIAQAPEDQIAAAAEQAGMISMKKQALDALERGDVSFETMSLLYCE